MSRLPGGISCATRACRPFEAGGVQAKDVHADDKKEIAALQQELDGVLEKDLGNFNRMLRDRGIKP